MKTREANELYEKADTQSLFPIFLPLDWTNKLDEEDPEDDDWTAYSGSYLPSDWIVLFVVVVNSTPSQNNKRKKNRKRNRLEETFPISYSTSPGDQNHIIGHEMGMGILKVTVVV